MAQQGADDEVLQVQIFAFLKHIILGSVTWTYMIIFVYLWQKTRKICASQPRSAPFR